MACLTLAKNVNEEEEVASRSGPKKEEEEEEGACQHVWQVEQEESGASFSSFPAASSYVKYVNCASKCLHFIPQTDRDYFAAEKQAARGLAPSSSSSLASRDQLRDTLSSPLLLHMGALKVGGAKQNFASFSLLLFFFSRKLTYFASQC